MSVMMAHFHASTDPLRAFVIPYYLAIFFFCSGYCYRQKEGFKDFVKKKCRQLLLPWFIFSNANILISRIHTIKYHRAGIVTEILRNLLQVKNFDERLWFIPALFVAYIPFYFVIRHYEEKKDLRFTLGLCAFLCVLRKIYKAYMNPEWLPWKVINLPWHIDYIPTSMLFMVLGYLFKSRWEKDFDSRISIRNIAILFIFYLLVVYVPYYSGAAMSWPIDLVYDHFRHFVGLALIISISKTLKPNRYLLFVGSNTLIYFCIHNKFVTLLEAIAKKVLPFVYANGESWISGIFCIVMTFVISLVLIPPTYLINTYLPWTAGRSIPKK